jgi:4a-hydroxytetrahydrobiopterin dehydratase
MGCSTQALSEAELRERLKRLPHWTLSGNALERAYEGKSYADALAALNRIAQRAEETDHHPDMTLVWKKLTIRYSTHTANGVTELDFNAAAQAYALLETL